MKTGRDECQSIPGWWRANARQREAEALAYWRTISRRGGGRTCSSVWKMPVVGERGDRTKKQRWKNENMYQLVGRRGLAPSCAFALTASGRAMIFTAETPHDGARVPIAEGTAGLLPCANPKLSSVFLPLPRA